MNIVCGKTSVVTKMQRPCLLPSVVETADVLMGFLRKHRLFQAIVFCAVEVLKNLIHATTGKGNNSPDCGAKKSAKIERNADRMTVETSGLN